jgi:hypothetical protein
MDDSLDIGFLKHSSTSNNDIYGVKIQAVAETMQQRQHGQFGTEKI